MQVAAYGYVSMESLQCGIYHLRYCFLIELRKIPNTFEFPLTSIIQVKFQDGASIQTKGPQENPKNSNLIFFIYDKSLSNFKKTKIKVYLS